MEEGTNVGGGGGGIVNDTEVSPMMPLHAKAILAFAIGPKLVAVRPENVAIPFTAEEEIVPPNNHEDPTTDADTMEVLFVIVLLYWSHIEIAGWTTNKDPLEVDDVGWVITLILVGAPNNRFCETFASV